MAGDEAADVEGDVEQRQHDEGEDSQLRGNRVLDSWNECFDVLGRPALVSSDPDDLYLGDGPPRVSSAVTPEKFATNLYDVLRDLWVRLRARK